MAEFLGALFHWSPVDRHKAIIKEGLQPFSPSATASVELRYVCLSPTPSMAWGLSGGMDHVTEIEEWDLWQVRLVETDNVQIRPNWGPKIEEVKVFNVIPPDRVWFVGRREA